MTGFTGLFDTVRIYILLFTIPHVRVHSHISTAVAC
jgi:hypothetical protein